MFQRTLVQLSRQVLSPRRARRRAAVEGLEGRTLLAFAPAGTEFQVNTTTASYQYAPDVASDADGDSVVVWQSRYQDGTPGYGVYAQRYDAAGARVGGEFRVNTYTADKQAWPKVAMDADGDFVVTWTSYGQDGDGAGIYAQRYNAAGQPQGAEFRVNTTTAGLQYGSDVAMDAAGDFAIVWDVDGPAAFGRWYDAAGNPLGGETQVNTTTTGLIMSPQVAASDGGTFLVNWHSHDQQPGSPFPFGSVRAQRFDRLGARLGGEFRVDTAADTLPYTAKADFDAAGNFVIAFDAYHEGVEDVLVRRYDASGTALGAPFLAAVTRGNVRGPDVAVGPAGDFVVTYGPGGGGNVYLRGFNALGAPTTGELRLNTNTATNKWFAAVALSDDGKVFTTWISDGQDGNFTGIFGQRYTPVTNPASVGDRVWEDDDLDGIQDAAEAGLDGVEVAAFTGAGTMAASAVTAGGGRYALENLRPGEPHYLQFTAPARHLFTRADAGDDSIDSDANPATGRTASFSPAEGAFDAAWDAGVVRTITVGGTVFIDIDDDGVRDPGEVGRQGVSVRLLDATGATLRTATTDAQGQYRFDDIAPTANPTPFRVQFVAPPTYGFGRMDQGSDDALDSDVDPATSRTAPFELAPGDVDLTRWAGLVPLGSLSGAKFYDLDADGVRDPDEPGLAGWTVFLDSDDDGALGASERSAVTGPDGLYAINNVRPGAYRLSEVPQLRWDLTTPVPARALVLAPGQSRTNLNLGGTPTAAVTHPRPVGAPMTVTPATPWFSPPGARWDYFANDDAGNFIVVGVVYRDGFEYDVVGRRYDAAGNPRGEQFTVNADTRASQFNPSVGMAPDGSFVVAWQSGSPDGREAVIKAQRFDAAGARVGGELLVSASGLGPQSRPSVAVGRDGRFVVGWDGYQGKTGVFAREYDASGEPVGEVVKLNTRNGPFLYPYDTDVAMDGAGNWVAVWAEKGSEPGDVWARRFTAAGLPLGSEFRVSSTKGNDQLFPSVGINAGGEFVITWQGPSVGAAGGSTYVARYDAAGVRQGAEFLAAPGGTSPQVPRVAVEDDGSFVLAFRYSTSRGWAVAARRFSGSGLPVDPVSLVSPPTGGEAADAVVSSIRGGAGGYYVAWHGAAGLTGGVQRFETFSETTTVGGFVWDDLDVDGVFDPGEQVVANVAVDLLNEAGAPAATTRTAADGTYSFRAVKPGATYTLLYTPPAGKFGTLANRGPNDAIDSDADPVGNREWFVAPAARRVDLSHAFGLAPPGRISGVRFNDRDGDGVRDAGEEGLSGWTVYLDLDDNGQAGPDDPSVATGLDGGFTFAGLAPGLYRVRVVPQPLWTATTGPEPVIVTVGPAQAVTGVALGARTTTLETRAVRVGGEVRVNTFASGRQTTGSVGMNGAGDAVVVWQSEGQDGSGAGIYGQRFGRDGAPLGAEFRVNTTVAGNQMSPRVAIAAAGGFVVVWQGDVEAGQVHIYGQRYGAGGAKVGDEFRVDAVGGVAASPDVAMDAAGNFAVAWQHRGGFIPGGDIHLRRFSAGGLPDGEEVAVSSGHTANYPRVAMRRDGQAVVVWEGVGPGNLNAPSQVFVRRVGRGGVVVGDQAVVNRSTPGVLPQLHQPDVDVDPADGFVVVWDSGHADVRARRFNADGTPRTDEIALGPGWGLAQAAVAADGSYAVAWTVFDPSSFEAWDDIRVQRFNAAGVPQGPGEIVNTTRSYVQTYAGLGSDAAGNLLVTWLSQPNRSNLEIADVYAQRFAVDRAPTAESVAPVVVNVGTPDAAVDLGPVFADDRDADAQLAYDVTGNSNPSLVQSAAVEGGVLRLVFTPGAAGSGVLTVRATDRSGLWVETPVQFVVRPATPAVSGVFVSGSGWTDSFRQRLAGAGLGDAGLGLRVSPAVAPDELPWAGLDRISLRFDRPVVMDASSLVVRGVNRDRYAVAAYSYDDATRTATWTLAGPVGADLLTVSLANGGVLDASSGAPFTVRMRVLPGDVTRSGRVDASDLARVRALARVRPAALAPAYDVWADVNADGVINGRDVDLVRAWQRAAVPEAPIATASAILQPVDRRGRTLRGGYGG